MTEQREARTIPEWAWMALLATLVFAVWWRGHTFGPSVREATGLTLWPVVRGSTEPLDCDEAAYAYMGRRMVDGAALYRDLAENKPPGGYWIYAIAVAIGGATEWTVRILPIPIVLATMFVVWRFAFELAGPNAATTATLIYVLLSTDPYLYGNGAQLELPLNLFSLLSLWALVRSSMSIKRGWLLAAGVCLALATLIRQTAAVNLVLYVGWIILAPASTLSGAASRGRQIALLLIGFALVLSAAAAVLISRGAWPAFIEMVVQGGYALVADTPSPPGAPPLWIRWFTGNADPNGVLPAPFGSTNYLVWWGSGSWPIWIAGLPALAWMLRGPSLARRLTALWTLSAWVQVALPRQFWAHYYLLPTPGLALCVAVAFADSGRGIIDGVKSRRIPSVCWGFVSATVLLGSIVATAYKQVNDYLLVRPEMLTVRYKGGQQWVRLRLIGQELRERAASWPDAKLFVWGWQSPLYFYSGLDCPTRHFFVNDLMKSFADSNHSLVSKWVDEIVTDLRAEPPLVIFTGYPPFNRLVRILSQDYARSNLVPELPVTWVIRGDRVQFDTGRRGGADVPSRAAELGIWEWLPLPQPRPASAAGIAPTRRYPAIAPPRN